MRTADRLVEILKLLRQGGRRRARDIAARLGVSQRTVYRDMERLAASGVPVEGTRGAGYRLGDAIPLPPLALSPAEMEVLNLGIAIVAEAEDPDLSAAAQSLAARIDAALPTQAVAEADAWRFASKPHASAARGFSHMTTLRSAIRGRQKLRLTRVDEGGTQIVRPLRLDRWGRIWTLAAWSDSAGGFREVRVDLIDAAQALPELFVDEPGKTLADFDAAVA